MNYDEISEIRVLNKDGSMIVYKEKGLEKFKKLFTPTVVQVQNVQKPNSKYAVSSTTIKPMSGGDIFSNAEALKNSSGLSFSK